MLKVYLLGLLVSIIIYFVYMLSELEEIKELIKEKKFSWKQHCSVLLFFALTSWFGAVFQCICYEDDDKDMDDWLLN